MPVQPTAPGGPLSVAVLIELVRTPLAGGQVRCWEHFADAAAGTDPDRLGVDLTLYVLGDRPRVEELSRAVRFVVLRPVLSTAPLNRGDGDVSDLAPHHPALARLLPRHDVWHVTHTLAFASTAARLRRRERRAGRPRPTGLVGSVHTDMPALTEAYVRRMLGARLDRHPRPARPRPGRPLRRPHAAPPRPRPRRLRPRAGGDTIPGARDGRARRRGAGQQARQGTGPRPLPAGPGRACRTGRPRRAAGPDRRRVRRTRRRLEERAAARGRRPAAACAGGDAHLVVAGAGPDTERIAALLGPGATLLGALPQERLARVLAGGDIFALPSRTETIGNVVGEAMACGLPVVLPAGTPTNHWLAEPGGDGLLVPDDTEEAWAAALGLLVDRPDLRAAMGERAAATVRARHRTWGRVLTDDLLPVWRGAAARTPVTGG